MPSGRLPPHRRTGIPSQLRAFLFLPLFRNPRALRPAAIVIMPNPPRQLLRRRRPKRQRHQLPLNKITQTRPALPDWRAASGHCWRWLLVAGCWLLVHILAATSSCLINFRPELFVLIRHRHQQPVAARNKFPPTDATTPRQTLGNEPARTLPVGHHLPFLSRQLGQVFADRTHPCPAIPSQTRRDIFPPPLLVPTPIIGRLIPQAVQIRMPAKTSGAR